MDKRSDGLGFKIEAYPGDGDPAECLRPLARLLARAAPRRGLVKSSLVAQESKEADGLPGSANSATMAL